MVSFGCRLNSEYRVSCSKIMCWKLSGRCGLLTPPLVPPPRLSLSIIVTAPSLSPPPAPLSSPPALLPSCRSCLPLPPHCLPSVKVLLILSHTVVMVGSVVTLCNVSLSDICICMMWGRDTPLSPLVSHILQNCENIFFQQSTLVLVSTAPA